MPQAHDAFLEQHLSSEPRDGDGDAATTAEVDMADFDAADEADDDEAVAVQQK